MIFDLLKVPLGDADAPDRERRASSVGTEQEGSGTMRHLLDDDDVGDDNAEKRRGEEELAETARIVGWHLNRVFRFGDVASLL